jgi:hypothetical protein
MYFVFHKRKSESKFMDVKEVIELVIGVDSDRKERFGMFSSLFSLFLKGSGATTLEISYREPCCIAIHADSKVGFCLFEIQMELRKDVSVNLPIHGRFKDFEQYIDAQRIKYP